LTRILPLKDAAGKVVRWFGTNTDISAQKKAEEALVKNEKLATVGRMAATIAHEINNPLAAAINAIYLASAGCELPEAARFHVEMAERELERVAHITKQTLGFYRESGSPATGGWPTLSPGFGEGWDTYSARLFTWAGVC